MLINFKYKFVCQIQGTKALNLNDKNVNVQGKTINWPGAICLAQIEIRPQALTTREPDQTVKAVTQQMYSTNCPISCMLTNKLLCSKHSISNTIDVNIFQ